MFFTEYNVVCAKYDVMDIAEYVLNYCKKNYDSYISNLRLQKILYYIQGEYVGTYHEPLYDNHIEAWTYGPVVPDAYYNYNSYGADKIKGFNDIDFSIFTDREKQLMNRVIERYKEGNIWSIVAQTHDESPWKLNYAEYANNEIPIEDLEEWFKNHQWGI